MNTQPRDVHAGRAPANATPDTIESTLASNREAIDHTLTEIQERFSPEGLTQMAMERLRSDSGTEFARGLRDTVVHNPMPVMVIALGIVWAAMSERSSSSSGQIGTSASGRSDEFASHAKAQTRQGGEGKSRLEAARGRTRDLASRGRARLSRSRGSASGHSSSASGQGSGMSVSRGWEFTREHPVLMAGAGVAFGAALAAMLPTTRMEREQLGPVRDEALRGTTRFASEAGRGAADAAAAGASTSAGADAPKSDSSEGREPYSASQTDAGDRGPAERRF